MVLATDGSAGGSRLAALFPSGTLALFGLRLVLAIGLFLGLGAVSLWPLV